MHLRFDLISYEYLCVITVIFFSFLAGFLNKVDDENNQKSPRSTMISHFAALKKKMKARMSTKKNRAKKAAEKELLLPGRLRKGQGMQLKNTCAMFL